MSLVNDYLKRLSSRPLRGSEKERIPPSLKRLQGERISGSGKTKIYFRFVGIIIAIYTVGYIFLSVATLLRPAQENFSFKQQPNEGVAQKEIQVLQDNERSFPSKKVPNVTQALSVPARSSIGDSAQLSDSTLEIHSAGSGAMKNMASGAQKVNTTVSYQNGQMSAAPATNERKRGHALQTKSERTGFDSKQTLHDKQEVHEEPYPLAAGFYGKMPGSKDEKAAVPKKRVLFTVSDDKPAYFFQIALQAHHNNNYKRAELYYKRVLQKEPAHEDSLVNLSAIYIREDRLAEAQKLLTRVLSVNKRNSKALVNAGMIALKQKNISEATKYFKKALRYNPIEETALVNLAYLAQQKHNYANAAQYYQKLLSVTQESTKTLLAFAGLQEQRQEYNSAIGLYRKSLELLNMQKSPERYEQIRQRIQILRQYVSQPRNQK